MKRVLIAGAAGFIGFHAAARLLERGIEVVGVDALNPDADSTLRRWRLRELADRHRGFRFVRKDICGVDDLRRLVERTKPDAALNLAARAGLRESFLDPYGFARTNAFGALCLLEACRAAGVRKYVLASTSSIYAGRRPPFDEATPAGESISPYAASKRAAETFAASFHAHAGMDVTVLRYFTVYGPFGRPDMSYFRFIEAVLNGEKITLFGTGSHARDFTYVDDAVEGTLAALERRRGRFEIFNLGTGRSTALSDLIRLVERFAGRPARVRRLRAHPADMPCTAADSRRAARALGWRPRVTLEEGLRRTVEWHLAHRKRLARL